jgi:3-methyladenine DNA glycosylase AlkC
MPEAFKDIFFQRPFFDDLVAALQSAYPEFDADAFRARIFDDQWDARPLKDKMRHATLTLHDFLPADYRTSLALLRQIAPALDRHGFEKMIFPDFVEVYGLEDWDASLPALEQFTQQMSAEYAVRPFIVRDQDRMMAQMLAWAHHASASVRRLATEGCRPRLPWAMALPALKADPAPILPILDALKADPSEDVRRSVANNLNDISKDNPDVVLDVLRRWQADPTPEMQKIINHALRTLIKAGHPGALDLLGFSAGADVAVRNLTVEPAAISVGDAITFAFEIESTADAPQDLVIDYVVHLVRARGKTSPKVFKLTKRTIAPGETIRLSKKHSFAAITTRRYYPGEHAVQIQINGAPFERQPFDLVEG